ncbi:cupredoxin domain-containing protein [Cellulomonas marina]|uniref:Plastocyanin n=1 Tax=Cellulomonas marina TaxID=988821 RepID=A0A1I0VWQ9_9CELL|nr:hypothetical protein [Cellulomonas marina]GIG27493.1 hypothetical protein Cma02nite_00930 [Cellulomonas marina]SFA80869.1 hypothetical protein SAMN05421867_10220 [Cellulomonas marina]
MRRRSLLAGAAVVLLVTAACGGAEEEAAGTPGPAVEGTVLVATLGTAEDPDAFEILLTDEAGTEVTTLPAGEYTVRVEDATTIHNFHLTGAGVDETTSVEGTEDTTWQVTFEPGEYTYTCDPHPPMTKTFTVS